MFHRAVKKIENSCIMIISWTTLITFRNLSLKKTQVIGLKDLKQIAIFLASNSSCQLPVNQQSTAVAASKMVA